MVCFSILKQNCIAKHWIDCLQSGEMFRKEVNIELFFVTSMCTCMSENNMPLIWRVWGILLYTSGWFCRSDRRNVCPIDNWRTLGPTYCKLRMGWAWLLKEPNWYWSYQDIFCKSQPRTLTVLPSFYIFF